MQLDDSFGAARFDGGPLPKSLRIGLAAPILIRPFAHLVNRDPLDLPEGIGSVGVTALAQSILADDRPLSIYSFDMSLDRPLSFHGPELSIHLAPFRRRHRMRDFMAAERRAVTDMIRGDNPDVVSAHWGYEHPLGALAAGVPVATTLHDWAPAILWYARTPYRAGRLLMLMATLARRRNHLLTAISPQIARSVRRWSGRDCRLTPLGLPDAEAIESPRLKPKRPPRLIAINQGFSRFKNVEVLLEAFAAIREALAGAELALLGYDFEVDGAAHNWAVQRGLDRDVRFVGQVPHDQVTGYLDQADLLVHTALEEALGLVLVEAMMRGLPVIAGARTPGPAWVLDQGRAGTLVDVRRPEAVSEAAIDLLRDDTRWANQSRTGLARAKDSFLQSAALLPFLAALGEVHRTANGNKG